MTEAEKHLPLPLLRSLLDADFGTGLFQWKTRTAEVHCGRDLHRWNARYAGKPALIRRSRKGYLLGTIHKRHVLAHRVLWAMAHGRWPEQFIDHINGDTSDNRLCNLREATLVENARNQKLHRTNSSGRCGVSWNARQGRYTAYIRIGDRKIHLGTFLDFDGAASAREAAEIQHGFHVNHGSAR